MYMHLATAGENLSDRLELRPTLAADNAMEASDSNPGGKQKRKAASSSTAIQSVANASGLTNGLGDASSGHGAKRSCKET
jgi:hypothetical protein